MSTCDHRDQWVSYCGEIDEDAMQCQATVDAHALADERDRYREAIERAMKLINKVPCDAADDELCPACEAQIVLRDALENRAASDEKGQDR